MSSNIGRLGIIIDKLNKITEMRIKNNIVLFIVWLIICLFNFLTPLSADDYCYMMIVGQEPAQIDTLGDVFTSISYHYMHSNGRSLVHALIQIFAGILGKTVFCIVNALMFVLFVQLIRKLANIDGKSYLYTIILIAFIWLFIPAFAETTLWLSGSVNYLWATTAALAFIYLINNIEKLSNRYYLYPIYLLIGVCCGWSHECCATALVGGVGLYYLLNFKKFRGPIIPIFIGLCIGALILILSPGTMGRAEGAGLLSSGIVAMIIRFVGGFVNFIIDGIPTAITLFIAVCALLFARPWGKNFVRENQLLLSIWLIAVLFSVFVGGTTHRSMFFVSSISTILLFKIFAECIKTTKANAVVTAILGVCAIGVLCAVMPAMIENRTCSQILHSMIDSPMGEKVVVAYDTPKLDNKLKRRYIKAEFGSGNGYKNQDWEVVAVSRMSGKKSIYILPTAFYDAIYESDKFCNEQNQILDGLYTTPDLRFFVKRMDDDVEITEEQLADAVVKYDIAKATTNDLGGYSFRQRLFLDILSKYKAHQIEKTSALTLLNTPFGRYLLIDKCEVKDNRYLNCEIIL